MSKTNVLPLRRTLFFAKLALEHFTIRMSLNFHPSRYVPALILLWNCSIVAIGADTTVRKTPVVQAVSKTLPSVVNIRTETVVEVRDPFAELFQDFWNPYYRQPRQDVRRSLGSGVVIDKEGYILTNDHVVRRATKIRIKFSDGREFDADRVAYDQRSDLALLRIVTPKGSEKKFAPVSFARDGDLLLGETVIALGNPFGLGGSVSQGILSSRDRQSPQAGEVLDMENWLQTDAAINPGNSGGPLINLDGDLIGINVAVHRQGQGIGFAIPIARVQETLGEFFAPERLRGLWFGARVTIDNNSLRLSRVEPNSPAAKAGLRRGDTVVQVNDHNVKDFVDWAKEVAGRGLKTVRLKIFRGGRFLTIPVTLVPEEKVFNSEAIKNRLGITIRNLTEQTAEDLGMSFYGGYLITHVEKGGPGSTAGLISGSVIQRVDDKQPESLVAFAKDILAHSAGDTVRLSVVWEIRAGGFLQRRVGLAKVKVQ